MIQPASLAGVTDIMLQLPDSFWEILMQPVVRGGKRRRQTTLGKQRLTRIPLPSVILGNVQSSKNKVDELQRNVHYQKHFKDCTNLAFTETWLTEHNQGTNLSNSGFGVPVWPDWKAEVTQGGGTCLYFGNFKEQKLWIKLLNGPVG